MPYLWRVAAHDFYLDKYVIAGIAFLGSIATGRNDQDLACLIWECLNCPLEWTFPRIELQMLHLTFDQLFFVRRRKHGIKRPKGRYVSPIINQRNHGMHELL
jgi:hypothetical protein